VSAPAKAALVASAALLFALAAPGHEAGSQPLPAAGTQTACRGPASLSGNFKLVGRITAKKTTCTAARKVVSLYSQFCGKAYAGQKDCPVRSGGKWLCSGRIVGPLSKGAPERQTCVRGRSTVQFTVAYFPPLDALPPPKRRTHRLPAAFAATSSGPWNAASKCVNTTPAGTVVPPLSPEFELHLLGGVPYALGNNLQSALISHQVPGILRSGFKTQTSPPRIPIFLTPSNFGLGASGISSHACSNVNGQALILRTDDPDLNGTAAHELFHAYSYALHGGGPYTKDTWWEEASATWFSGRVFKEDTRSDYVLQYPDNPLDTPPFGGPGSPQEASPYPYGMSRFVQFLDDHGLSDWPLQQAMSVGRDKATETLAVNLTQRGHKLGVELAAFWGDRLRAKPTHGPQLVPAPPDNAVGITVKPGTETIHVTAKRLHTKLTDFKLSPKVKRVEFEFHPKKGYFWGLVAKPNESRRFEDDDSVTFCVGGKGTTDELEWPGNFPVTYTNGELGGGALTGEIKIYAQADVGKCKKSSGGPGGESNRACQVLKNSGVDTVLGNGIFAFSADHSDATHNEFLCFYEGATGEARLDLAEYPSETAKQVRKKTEDLITALKLSPIKLGDLAGIGTISGGDNVTGVVAMAVGKDIVLLMVGPGARAGDITTLAKRIAGEIS
jgi:hypothetical protein